MMLLILLPSRSNLIFIAAVFHSYCRVCFDQVSLEDLYNGTMRKLALQKNVICNKCDGRGGKEVCLVPNSPHTCIWQKFTNFHNDVLGSAGVYNIMPLTSKTKSWLWYCISFKLSSRSWTLLSLRGFLFRYSGFLCRFSSLTTINISRQYGSAVIGTCFCGHALVAKLNKKICQELSAICVN